MRKRDGKISRKRREKSHKLLEEGWNRKIYLERKMARNEKHIIVKIYEETVKKAWKIKTSEALSVRKMGRLKNKREGKAKREMNKSK